MATTRVTPDGDATVNEIQIAAAPEHVFQALVDPKQVVQWWGQAGVYRCTKFHTDLRAGGEWRSAGVDGDGRGFEVSGEYLQVQPPRLLVYTWVASWTGSVKTTVRWEFEPTNHFAFCAKRGDLPDSSSGWPTSARQNPTIDDVYLRIA